MMRSFHSQADTTDHLDHLNYQLLQARKRLGMSSRSSGRPRSFSTMELNPRLLTHHRQCVRITIIPPQ